MRYTRLRWVTVVGPALLFGSFEYVHHALLGSAITAAADAALVAVVSVLGASVFSRYVFGVIDRLQRDLVRTNDELAALNQASLVVASDLSMEAVLQRVVDLSRQMVRARYGALAVLGAGGVFERFVTSGLDDLECSRIGPTLQKAGLLGAVIAEGKPIRVPVIAADDRSEGFPPGHPPMTSLLGIPLCSKGQVIGGLYLTDKLDAHGQQTEFSDRDEQVLALFAAPAAVAIENARLYQTAQQVAVLEERERIAREMHDGLAQVLGYVNTKTLAVRRLLETGRLADARDQLSQLEAAARDVYADVREGILALRSTVGPERGLLSVLREYLGDFEQQSGVAVELRVPEEMSSLHLSTAAEIQLLRIIQEALSNVRKHAGASHAVVAFGQGNGVTSVTIEDDGRGFDAHYAGARDWPRFGLQTMKERAEAIGGVFAIESTPGRGTRVRVAIREPRTGGNARGISACAPGR